MRPLVDPRLREDTREHYTSKCTIQLVIPTYNAANEPVGNTGTDIVGMIDIPCRIAPLILLRPTDNEVRTSEVESEFTHRQCKLLGYFPQIKSRIMQAVVDGETFPIRGIEADSALFSTRLKLEVVEL